MEQPNITKLENPSKNTKTFTDELETLFTKECSYSNSAINSYGSLFSHHIQRYDDYIKKQKSPGNKENKFSDIVPNCFFHFSTYINTKSAVNIINDVILGIFNHLTMINDDTIAQIILRAESNKLERQYNYYQYVIQPLIILKQQNEELWDAWLWYTSNVETSEDSLNTNIIKYIICDKIQTKAYDVFSKFIEFINYLFFSYSKIEKLPVVVENIEKMINACSNERLHKFKHYLHDAVAELLIKTHYYCYTRLRNDSVPKSIFTPENITPSTTAKEPISTINTAKELLQHFTIGNLISYLRNRSPIHTKEKEPPFLLMEILGIDKKCSYKKAYDVYWEKTMEKTLTYYEYFNKYKKSKLKNNKFINENYENPSLQLQGFSKIMEEMFDPLSDNNYTKYQTDPAYRNSINDGLNLYPQVIEHFKSPSNQKLVDDSIFEPKNH